MGFNSGLPYHITLYLSGINQTIEKRQGTIHKGGKRLVQPIPLLLDADLCNPAPHGCPLSAPAAPPRSQVNS